MNLQHENQYLRSFATSVSHNSASMFVVQLWNLSKIVFLMHTLLYVLVKNTSERMRIVLLSDTLETLKKSPKNKSTSFERENSAYIGGANDSLSEQTLNKLLPAQTMRKMWNIQHMSYRTSNQTSLGNSIQWNCLYSTKAVIEIVSGLIWAIWLE